MVDFSTVGKTVNDIINKNPFKELAHQHNRKEKFQLFNSLSKKKEIFIPIDKNNITIYTCGPTVYHFAHIGNLRSMILPDIIKRILKIIDYKEITHVMNFTDVGHLTDDSGDSGEDKMEKASRREGKTARDVAEFYEIAFVQDLENINISFPKKFGKATDYIPEQIKMIETLESKGYVYKIEGDGMYMDTSKITDYGKLLSEKHLDGLQKGHRVDDAGKRNITDFALRKFHIGEGKRDMERQSPWGIGFPGWHIECSAISTSELGNTIDIHTGGIDLIPIHHTNEIAQSECCTGKEFVHYRVHGEFLNSENDEKMAKSGDNFIYLEILKNKGFDPLAYKFFTYMTHYKKQMRFSYDLMEQAQKGYDNIKKKIHEKIKNTTSEGELFSEKYSTEIINACIDDLNMPQALAILQKAISEKNFSGIIFEKFIHNIDLIFGLNLLIHNETNVSIDIPTEITLLAEQRLDAKNNKNRGLADELRKQIDEGGFAVQDTKDGFTIIKR